METKKCTKCKIIKGVNEFHKTRSDCKKCKSIEKKEYDKLNHKYITFYSWNRRGVKFINDEHFNNFYDYYVNLKQCDFCKKEFKNSSDRQLEHIHLNIKNNIRGVACGVCNVKFRQLDILRLKLFLELNKYYFRVMA